MKFMGYEIKFGIEATTKSGILKEIKAVQTAEGDAFSAIDTLLTLVPKVLLVGLQKKYREIFGYDYNTEEGKEEALRKVYDLVDDYMDQEDSSIGNLFAELSEELVLNGFFKKQVAQEPEAKKEEKKEQKTEK